MSRTFLLRFSLSYSYFSLGEVLLLREVVESVQRHVRNPSHIFQLSHDAYKAATLPTGVSDSSMLNVAMQLSMQVEN